MIIQYWKYCHGGIFLQKTPILPADVSLSDQQKSVLIVHEII